MFVSQWSVMATTPSKSMRDWVPAFAGMTAWGMEGRRGAVQIAGTARKMVSWLIVGTAMVITIHARYR